MIRSIIACAVVALLCTGCTDDSGTQRVLMEQGYTHVLSTGYGLFNCGHDDFFSTTFVAESPNHTIVHGVVCEGYFKGATIRWL